MNVRKRIIRVLKDIFANGISYLKMGAQLPVEELKMEHELLVDVVVKLLSRVKDEEETVRV